MNFTYVLGFVVLRDVVKVFPASSCSFARKTTGRNQARSHSGAWRGLKTKWDLNCLFRVRHISSDTCLSKSEKELPSSSSTLSSSDSSGAWISSHFRIQVRSTDECVRPGRSQPRETRWTSDGRLSSPETNLKVGLLPLFFMQLLLSHMFLSFMVQTSPLMWIYADPFVFVACCAGKDVCSTSTYLSSVHHVWRYVKENHFHAPLFDQSWLVDPSPKQNLTAGCLETCRACALHHNVVSWRALA